MSKAVAVVQARMSSERLPGKVMMALGGKPVLVNVIERLRLARRLSAIVIATSDRQDDDAIADLALAQRCEVYRGSLADVLARYSGAAKQVAADVVVRITADCPLICGEIIDDMLNRREDAASSVQKSIVVTNSRLRTFPRGLDVEVFTADALTLMNREAHAAHQREHVTPYLYEHSQSFEIIDFAQQRDMSAARWTLDTQDDYKMLSAFFSLFGQRNDLSLSELVSLWDANPALHGINAGVAQKSYSSEP